MISNLAKNMRKMVFSMAIPLTIVAEVHASVDDVNDIIDICTSSQRVMKDYAMIGMKITYHDPQKDLDETIKKMDEEIEALLKRKISKELHDEEEALHKEWVKIEEELKQAVTKENALTIHHHINTFAKHCEVLAEHLAEDTGNPAEHYVVLIARMNMDVQQLAAVYIMKAWGAIGDEEYFKEVDHILEDFNKAYRELQAADSKMVSDGVKAKLKTLKKHFMVFEFMTKSKSGRYVPLLIAKKAEKIYAETIEILKLEKSEVEK